MKNMTKRERPFLDIQTYDLRNYVIFSGLFASSGWQSDSEGSDVPVENPIVNQNAQEMQIDQTPPQHLMPPLVQESNFAS